MLNELQLRILEIAGTWFGAIATVAAVALALLLQRITEWRRRPTIQLLYDAESHGDNRYLAPNGPPKGSVPGRHELWLRLRVRNSSRFPARDVELKVIGTLIGNNGQRQNRPGWSFKVSNLNSVRVTIHPKFTQYYDIAYSIYIPEQQLLQAHFVLTTPAAQDWLTVKQGIEAEPEYTGITIGWPHQILFAVVGENIEAKYFRMNVQVAPVGKLANCEENLRKCLVASAPEQIDPQLAFEEGTKRARS